jgi:hypothetical protein
MRNETCNGNRSEAAEMTKTGERDFVIEFLTKRVKRTRELQAKFRECDARITKQNRAETFDAYRQRMSVVSTPLFGHQRVFVPASIGR